MNDTRIKRMAGKIANEEDDTAFENVDQAIDTVIAGLISLQENLPEVKAENVPQRAAIDNVIELLNEALLPYMSDVAKLMQVFGD